MSAGVELPTIPGPVPALPGGANHDAQMRHFEARMRAFEASVRLLEFQQRERHNADANAREAAADARNAALVKAQTDLAQAQEAVRLVMIRHADAAERMANLLAQPAAPSPSPPAPAPVAPWQARLEAMVTLVASMPMSRRENPEAAAKAAADQLTAITGWA